ncbi:MAG TPA: 2-phosphosulfolactate phosphatase [Acidimicrobiales bacterium]|nr:2-phosphosulfolactate phosphatase [Acidimicrobiales bacterium]
MLRQQASDVRFEWGPSGAQAVATPRGCTVVVDVLSFTTAVSVAVGRGISVLPYDLAQPGAEQFARDNDAQLGVRRREASPSRPWSLSPSALRSAPFTPRLVLPSPNGAAISASVEGTVVAGCLRNARAVAAWALENGYGTSTAPISVVAAGERWPDGTLRPAVEDAIGAGSVLDHLARAGCQLSPEAQAIAGLFRSSGDIVGIVRACGTALELDAMGFPQDVEVALEIEAEEIVPVLQNSVFGPTPRAS